MGWGQLLFSDLIKQFDLTKNKSEVEQLKRSIEASRTRARTADERLAVLQIENDQLKLYIAAILRILVSKGLATTSEVQELVKAAEPGSD